VDLGGEQQKRWVAACKGPNEYVEAHNNRNAEVKAGSNNDDQPRTLYTAQSNNGCAALE
jgi:hypothetical protein